VALFALILPFVRYGLLVLALGSVQLRYRPQWLGPVFRWALLLDRWAMPEVFLAACVIGYERVVAQAPVITVGAGGYCFLVAALLAMLCRALLDRRTVWRAIAPERSAPGPTAVLSCITCDLVLPLDAQGRSCPRCGRRLWARKPGAWERTLALVIAGLLLYLPANIYPMSVTHILGGTRSYRIIDGIRDLIQIGLWPLAAIVFVASVAIPVAKLMGLGWCLLSVRQGRWRSAKHIVLKTHVFRIIDEIGRWSCIDPFILAVTVPVMHYRGLLRIDAGSAANFFMSVVVVTMVASHYFDPRLLWDAALEHAHG
jgi:paraquat-inducible protein A